MLQFVGLAAVYVVSSWTGVSVQVCLRLVYSPPHIAWSCACAESPTAAFQLARRLLVNVRFGLC